MSLIGSFVATAVHALNPLALVGYCAAAFVRSYWVAVLATLAWAIGLSAVQDMGSTSSALPMRIVGALIVTSTVYLGFRADRYALARREPDGPADRKVPERLGWAAVLTFVAASGLMVAFGA